MSDRLLPVGSSPLEIAAAAVAAEITRVPVPLRTLWNPWKCPVAFLPYLAWALSVDRWDFNWPENTKRSVIDSAFFVHQHKGTISALRRVVETLGFLIEVREWWQLNETPGTFRLVVGVLDNGITDEMYQELERLIDDTKPASRHLTGMIIQLVTKGDLCCAASSYSGDSLTVYAYTPSLISVSAMEARGAGVHMIDEMRINPS